MSDDVEEIYVYSDDEYYLNEEESEHTEDNQSRLAGGKSSLINLGRIPPCGYRKVQENEIQYEQQAIIDEMASFMGISAECAEALLIHYKWNKSELFDRYYDNMETIQIQAGIKFLGKRGVVNEPFMCTICFDDFGPEEGFALGCNHVFCRECWKGYLTAAVNNEGANCIHKRCPAEKCGEAVLFSCVQELAPPEIAKKWQEFGQKFFVSTNTNMALCPAPSCSNAYITVSGSVRTAKCDCGMKFCLRCSNEAHEPATCLEYANWREKCESESETANWIMLNTKRCPKCSVRIEKNKGCNHVLCTNKGCKFQFCWVCLAPWSEHGQSTGGYYGCNKFKKAEKTDADVDQAKLDLDKYLFYYSRYSNHEASGRFAVKQRKETEEKMKDLAAGFGDGLGWDDVSFLETATETLIECRRVLKYTYVVGYYMDDGPEKVLFEHLQEQLERATEHLAELTEVPFEKIDRSDVINYSRVTKQFLNHLLEGVEEGFTS